jgi:hypothetical protein
VAICFPALYVGAAGNIFEFIWLGTLPTGLKNIAHGVILVLLAGASSLARQKMRDVNYLRGQLATPLWMDILILIAASYLLYLAVASQSPGADPADLVSPYYQYLLVLVFCLGAGYALASFIVRIFQR